MDKRGVPALGAWLSLPSVPSARIMARLGFDWLLVDMEHSAQNPVLMADMVATIADAGTSAPIVRVPGNSVEWFKWALDAGAWGVVVPMVNTREEAQQAVAYTRYPPLGARSIGGAFGPYGFGITDWPSYARAANDLHAQLGLTPSIGGAEPEFVAALEQIQAAAQKYHIATGIFSGDGEAATERVRQGFQMINVTADISSMIAAA